VITVPTVEMVARTYSAALRLLYYCITITDVAVLHSIKGYISCVTLDALFTRMHHVGPIDRSIRWLMFLSQFNS
jgi:hypothetical protein